MSNVSPTEEYHSKTMSYLCVCGIKQGVRAGLNYNNVSQQTTTSCLEFLPFVEQAVNEVHKLVEVNLA